MMTVPPLSAVSCAGAGGTALDTGIGTTGRQAGSVAFYTVHALPSNVTVDDHHCEIDHYIHEISRTLSELLNTPLQTE